MMTSRISYMERRRIDRTLQRLFGNTEQELRSGRKRQRPRHWEETKGGIEPDSDGSR